MTNEDLVQLIRSGVDPAENMLQLWEQMKDFIGSIAWKYKGVAEPEDLEQEGYLALYDAVDGYDQERGNAFTTYAGFWIKQRMIQYIKNNCSAVRISSHEFNKISAYRKLVAELEEQIGRKPSRAEIRSYTGLSGEYVDKVEKTMSIMWTDSLDRQIETDEGDLRTLGETIAAQGNLEQAALDKADHVLLQSILWPMVDALPGTQGTVIKIKARRNLSLKDIGKILGMPVEEVRRSERKGMQTLRRSSSAKRLRPFLPEYEDIYNKALHGNGAGRFAATWTSSTERVALGLILE